MTTYIKQRILKPAYHHLRAIYNRLDAHIIRIFSINGFFASFYYCFLSTRFYREHRAVLSGRIAYEKSLTSNTHSSVLLRRNIHRLEKGLIMRPRRKIFAKDYVKETVDCFAHCLQSENACQEELTWANDVLQQYFEATDIADPIILKAHNRFQDLSHDLGSPKHSVPYPRANSPESSISYEDLEILFKQRRSVRWYQNKPVTMDMIHKATRLASQAPSACNRQPYRFHTILNKEDAQTVGRIAIGTEGFSQQFPALIVVIGDLSAYPFERDRHVIYIDASLAAMQLMLALESLGLSSCPINWPDIESCEKKLATTLGLHPHERPIMLLSVGYAEKSGLIPYSQKKRPELLIKEVKL